MRLLVSLAALVILALMGLAGCNSKDKAGANNSAATIHTTSTTTQPPATASSDGARRITTVELNEALGKGEAIVIDVRGDAAYKQAHIKGAIMIPSNEVANHLSELPHDKMIVTYCS
ncbi:MAG TPA: rhodanese-like domain-containing protein [Pyrinomonadaceae bacterium]